MSKETRVTSSTGGQKGSKIERYDLIPTGPLRALAVHFGKGARKYDDGQWRKGYPWSLTTSALMRHLEAWREGLDFDVCSNDPEGCKFTDNDGNPYEPSEPDTCYNHTGSHHLDAVMWHAFVAREFVETHPEHDDRYATVLRREQEAAEDQEAAEEYYEHTLATLVRLAENPRFISIPAGGDVKPFTDLGAMWTLPEEGAKFGVFEDFDVEAHQQALRSWSDETITLHLEGVNVDAMRLMLGLPLREPRFVVGVETEDLDPLGLINEAFQTRD